MGKVRTLIYSEGKFLVPGKESFEEVSAHDVDKKDLFLIILPRKYFLVDKYSFPT